MATCVFTLLASAKTSFKSQQISPYTIGRHAGLDPTSDRLSDVLRLHCADRLRAADSRGSGHRRRRRVELPASPLLANRVCGLPCGRDRWRQFYVRHWLSLGTQYLYATSALREVIRIGERGAVSARC